MSGDPPNPSQTHLLFNHIRISIWLMSGFSRWRPFYLQVSVVKWLILGELILGSVSASGGGHWHLWNGLPNRVWWCLAHGSSKGTGWNFACHTWWWQSLISLWGSWTCRASANHWKSLEKGIIYSVCLKIVVWDACSVWTILVLKRKISVASVEKEKLRLPKAPSS